MIRTALCVAICLLLSAGRNARGDDAALAPYRFVREWGGQGAEPGKFHFPIGVAVDRRDELYVADFKNARVQKFTSDGKFLAAFPVSDYPGGIACDAEGNVYVTHAGISPSKTVGPRKRDKIAVFTADGKLLREWGQYGTGDGQFDMPGGIVISRDARVYVADQCNRRIQVFDTQGNFLFKWGQKGFEPGQFGGNPYPQAFFAGPTWLAFDRAGNLLTTEASLGRVQKFTPEGKFLLAFGDNEVAPGKFGGYFTAFGRNVLQGPTGIALDPQGRLWINSIGGRIQQFSDTGEYLAGFGSEGSEPGQFYAPHGLAIDSHGSLYVVDAYNHRIQKFSPAQP